MSRSKFDPMPVQSKDFTTSKAQLDCLAADIGIIGHKNEAFSVSYLIVDSKSKQPIENINWNVTNLCFRHF